MSITLDQINNAVIHMKQHAEKPKIVKDQAEADAMNVHDVELYARVGLEPKRTWNIGDEYYWVE